MVGGRAVNELERLKFWLHLLEMEVAALRSVLAEYTEKSDHTQFTQWHKAQAIDELKNHLVHP